MSKVFSCGNVISVSQHGGPRWSWRMWKLGGYGRNWRKCYCESQTWTFPASELAAVELFTCGFVYFSWTRSGWCQLTVRQCKLHSKVARLLLKRARVLDLSAWCRSQLSVSWSGRRPRAAASWTEKVARARSKHSNKGRRSTPKLVCGFWEKLEAPKMSLTTSKAGFIHQTLWYCFT